MEEQILLRDAPNEHLMLIGNMAMTRACLETGIQFVSQYPGTPVTDMGTYFSRIARKVPGLYFQWASNESASITAAAGASWCGIKSLAIMKHVGANVASDALSVIALNGPTSADGRGGLLVILGGDPGSLGSHSEQNDRFYSWMLHLCHFEPSTVQEAKAWIPEALDVSQKFDLVSYFRVTSRVAHTVEEVTLGRLPEFRDDKGKFIKNIPKFCSLPPHCINNHKRLYERMEKVEPYVSRFNKIIPGDSKFGIITGGVPFGYTVEALRNLGLNDVPILKLGVVHPINENQFVEFAQNLDKILVVEELEPFLEVQVKRLAQEHRISAEILGKKVLRGWGELNTGEVATGISKVLGKPLDSSINQKLDKYQNYLKLVPPRPPTFCPGCPERALLFSIKAATDEDETIYAGDIGCYVMSFFPPMGITDWVICMSGGLGAAVGAAIKTDQKIIALMGDSTFYHTGIQILVNAVYNNADVILIILDNSWTAMTGGHPHPGAGINGMGDPTPIPSIRDICRSLGVKWVRVTDPFEPYLMTSTLLDAKKQPGIKVIVSQRECMLQYRKRLLKTLRTAPPRSREVFWIEPERCQMCGTCAENLCCTALRRNPDYMSIDEDRCSLCGVCYEICPNDAIAHTIINPHLEGGS
ncbi:MAG: indolepyruvate ferredoxin oxidoreductase subunit alpha [Candidatus Helarchaeota archaeon]|nr:indolepyruvate ferredoxin oxidoreductase subunit alpha [Candidatus Helarchaeota archaeon]